MPPYRFFYRTVLGKTPAAEMLTAVEALMKGLRLTVNAEKTRSVGCRRNRLSSSASGSEATTGHRRAAPPWVRAQVRQASKVSAVA